MSYPYRYANNQSQPTDNQQQQNNSRQWMNQAFSPYANNNTNNNAMHQMPQQQYNPNPPYHNQPPNSFYSHSQYGNNPNPPQYNVNPPQFQSGLHSAKVATACQQLININKAEAATKFTAKKDDTGYRCVRVSFYLERDITGYNNLLLFLKNQNSDKKDYIQIKLAAKDTFAAAITNHLTIQNKVFHKLGFTLQEICKLTANSNWKNGIDIHNKKISKVKSGQNHAHMYAALLLSGKIVDVQAAKKFKLDINISSNNNTSNNNSNSNNSNSNNSNSNNSTNNSNNTLPPHVQPQSHHVQHQYPQHHPNAPPQQHLNAPPQQHPNAPPPQQKPNTANNFVNHQNMINTQQQIDQLIATCSQSADFFRLIHYLQYPSTSTIPVHILIDIMKHNLNEDEINKIESEFDLRFRFRD
eukprot:164006_1